MAPEATMNPHTPVSGTPSSAFLSKVTSLPIVNSAVDVAKFYYDETKTRFVIVRQVEKGFVERVVPQVVSATTKVTPQKAQVLVTQGLAQLDQYAATGLELLENKVPIIKEPTPRILESIFTPVIGVVEKALDYSEEKVEYYLPAESNPEKEGNDDGQQPQIGTVAGRAQHLRVVITQRLFTKLSHQVELIKKLSPQEIQKFSLELVNQILVAAERQASYLKETLSTLPQKFSKEELSKLATALESQLGELIAVIKRTTDWMQGPGFDLVRQNLQVAPLLHQASEYADKIKGVLSSVLHDLQASNDPYLKTIFSAIQNTNLALQRFIQHLHVPSLAADAPSEVSENGN